jgi:hypothetical protein
LRTPKHSRHSIHSGYHLQRQEEEQGQFSATMDAWDCSDESSARCWGSGDLHTRLETLRHSTLMLEDVVRVSRERRIELERTHRRQVARLERLAAAAQSRLALAREETATLLLESASRRK